jgi:hypothetical protein
LARALELFDAVPKSICVEITLPDKDLPILWAAMAARATHLITGDVRHFGPYFGKRIEGTLVLLPAHYLQRNS